MVTTSGVTGSSVQNLFTDQIDNPNSALGKTAFLELLIQKLKYQDPLKPMTDDSFIADMAQFSSLEQMSNMNSSVSGQTDQLTVLNTNLLNLILMQNTTQAAGLIGKNVSMQVPKLDGSTATVTGRVDVVRFVDGMPKLVVNGTEYELSYVKEITA
jgi:flagellar basal-body rod modification protein FlgD